MSNTLGQESLSG